MPTPLNMTGHCPPRIQTPEFWPATEAAYRAVLDGLRSCKVEVIGRSAGGRDIWGVTWRSCPEAPTLAVCGGMHGHEAQGPAACLNLLNVLETGRDLKNRQWQALARANWAVVPIINPDARARMPNAFVGLSVQDVLNYDAGLRLSGERNDRSGDVAPEEMLLLGGLYNDAGVDIIRHPQREENASPELHAVLSFIERARPAVCLELHAHCAQAQFYCPLAPTPQEVRARQVALTEAIIAAGNGEGYDFAPNTGEVAGLSTALYHEVAGATPLLFESPQGVLDRGPRWTHEQIIDVNLFVMSELARALVG